MKRILTPLFLLLTLFVSGQDQSHSDSLIKVLETTDPGSDETYVLLLQICDELLYWKPVEAAGYGVRACDLARERRDKELLAKASRQTADAWYRARMLDSSRVYMEEALGLYGELGDSLAIAKGWQKMGRILAEKGKYNSAMDYTLKSLNYFERKGTELEQAGLYHDLGTVYGNLLDREKEFIYCGKALEIYRREGDKWGIAACLTDRISYYFERNDTLNIYLTLTEAIALFHEVGDYTNEAHALINLADYYDVMMDDLEQSLANYNKAIAILGDTGFNHLRMEAYRNMAIACYRHKDYESALNYTLTAVEVTDTTNRAYVQMNYYLLTYVYMALRDFPHGEYAFDNYVRLTNEIYDESLVNSVAEMEVKYETEKRNREILRLNSANKIRTIILYSLIVVILAGIVLIYFIIRSHRQERVIAEQRANELLRTQQLSATQSLLSREETERRRVARELHDGLGGLLSGVKLKLTGLQGDLLLDDEKTREFNRAIGILDDSVKELRRVAHNMMPDTLARYGLKEALQEFCSGMHSNRMDISFNFFGEAGRIGHLTEVAVYRIAQELLHNAIKHSGGTRTEVQLVQEENRVSLTVSDNGRGFDMEASAEKDGMGLRSIRSRVEALRGVLDIRSEIGTGTEVMVAFITGIESAGNGETTLTED